MVIQNHKVGLVGDYWTLDQKHINTATDSDSFQYNLSTPLSGYYLDSSASYQGSYGSWWSSTYDSSGSMHVMDVSPTYVSSSDYNDRYYGLSMRCLVAD